MEKGISSNTKEIGANLQTAREARFKGISRENFCKAVLTAIEDYYQETEGTDPPKELSNLNEGKYKQWEYGNNPIDSRFIPFLCRYLQIDTGFLFGEYPEFTRQNSDIVAETGFTQDNVEKLMHYKHIKEVISFLNTFIEAFITVGTVRDLQYAIMSRSIHNRCISFNEDQYMFAQQLRMLLSNDLEQHYIMNDKEYILPPGAFLVDAGNATESYIDSITNKFREVLSDFVKNAASQKGGE